MYGDRKKNAMPKAIENKVIANPTCPMLPGYILSRRKVTQISTDVMAIRLINFIYNK
jgi:hypothetical protein